jgi:EmrB/QacA subfamily drug resistance transporter
MEILSDPRVGPSRTGPILTVLSAAAFMASLDLFIVNVAFARIGHDFHQVSLGDVSWILNGYAILYAALLIPLGRLSDRYGRKFGFLLGLGAFSAASLGCALSPSLWILVALRLFQAAGAAALTPTSLGLLINAYPAERRSGAVRVWAAVSALAAAAGPVLGGVLVQHSWRLVFLVNVPVGVIAIVAAVMIVPDSRDQTETLIPDLLGAAILAVAIGCVALGLVKGPNWGWTAPATLSSFGVAVVGIAVFWYRSGRQRSPVIDPALLRVRSFAWANATSLAFSVAFSANLLLAILWMQNVWHFSPIKTGLCVAPGPLMVPGFAILGGHLARRFGVGKVTAAGCVLFGAGVGITQILLGESPHYLSEMLPGQIVGGIGVGLALPTILSSATSGLPPAKAATGSAVVNMNRQIGSVIGVSVLIALIGSPSTYTAAAAGFEHARLACIVAALIGASAAFGMTQRAEAEEPTGAVIGPSAARTSPVATVEASLD